MLVIAAISAACAAAEPAQAAPWTTFGGNAQHTGISTTPSQSLTRVLWSTSVDLSPPGEPLLIHYGSPLITQANTLIIPVKTSAGDGFRLDARRGGNGALIWSASTDYLLPPHGFVPGYSPTLTAAGRVWYPGAGGTIHFRDGADSAAPTASGRVAFYGIANYSAAPASFAATVFVNTPITVGASGTIYFGFRTAGAAPLGLASGIARITSTGDATWVAATTIAGDLATTVVPHQAAPALSNDESTLYVAVSDEFGDNAYLAALDPVTLAVKNASPGVLMRVQLKDPRSGGASNAMVSDSSTGSPMVGPDGDVYYGALGNPYNGSRGWLLHYSANLQQTKTPGAFGWDTTGAVVPKSAVPAYTGPSSYLIFTKYNDYAGGDGGEGVNRIAILDPNDTMPEPHPSSNGLPVMRVIMSIAGPTPDEDLIQFYPNAVMEWCINAAAVDPITRSVMVNSEDGKLYRWDLTTNTLSQAVTLSGGVRQAYTPTLIGPDGTVFATNKAILSAVGSNAIVTVVRNGSGGGSVSSNPAGIACGPVCGGQFASEQGVTLTATPAVGSAFTGWLGACTGRGTCQLSPQGNVLVTAMFAPDTVEPLTFDVDGNRVYDALTDGMIAIRYLFGLSGTQLTRGALGTGATRIDPVMLRQYLDDIRPSFDIDGNGSVDALTDGLLLLRYLFAMRGDALTVGAIGPGATRTTSTAIQAYILPLLP